MNAIDDCELKITQDFVNKNFFIRLKLEIKSKHLISLINQYGLKPSESGEPIYIYICYSCSSKWVLITHVIRFKKKFTLGYLFDRQNLKISSFSEYSGIDKPKI